MALGEGSGCEEGQGVGPCHQGSHSPPGLWQDPEPEVPPGVATTSGCPKASFLSLSLPLLKGPGYGLGSALACAPAGLSATCATHATQLRGGQRVPAKASRGSSPRHCSFLQTTGCRGLRVPCGAVTVSPPPPVRALFGRRPP